MIRHAKILEINDILNITTLCAKHMVGKGIYQWNEHYPSKEVFIRDIQKGELYTLSIAGLMIGLMAISTYMDDVYTPIEWLTPNKRNMYVHRLAVHPHYQGKGYAQQLMDFAENYARENEYVSVRLDTFSQNKRNQKFYETRGYQRLGAIYFHKQSNKPFYCYELVL